MNEDRSLPQRRTGASRKHQWPGRSVRLTLRYSAAESADIRCAATAAGVTATSYAADAAIAAARGNAGGGGVTDRQVVLELLASRSQLRRYGNNLNQAARILNAGGDPSEWLKNAIALTDRVVHSIDRAVQDLLDSASRRA